MPGEGLRRCSWVPRPAQLFGAAYTFRMRHFRDENQISLRPWAIVKWQNKQRLDSKQDRKKTEAECSESREGADSAAASCQRPRPRHCYFRKRAVVLRRLGLA